jgi:hypothetical protein
MTKLATRSGSAANMRGRRRPRGVSSRSLQLPTIGLLAASQIFAAAKTRLIAKGGSSSTSVENLRK